MPVTRDRQPPGADCHRAGPSFAGQPSHRVERAAKRPLAGGAPGFRAVGKKNNIRGRTTGRTAGSESPARQPFPEVIRYE